MPQLVEIAKSYCTKCMQTKQNLKNLDTLKMYNVKSVEKYIQSLSLVSTMRIA